MGRTIRVIRIVVLYLTPSPHFDDPQKSKVDKDEYESLGGGWGWECEETGAIVAHEFVAVAVVKDLAQDFGQGIRWVEGRADTLDDDLALLHPILNGVELDVEVAGASRWLAVIGKALGTFVVTKQGSRRCVEGSLTSMAIWRV